MRRVWSVLLAAVIGIALTGCALSDPLISGTPQAPPTDPVLTAQITAAVPLINAAEQAVAGRATADPTNASLPVMLATLAAQAQVLASQDPLSRTPGQASTPPTADPSVNPNDALAAARDAFSANATTQPGFKALFWASLAASAEQMRLGLMNGYSSPVAAQPDRTVETMTSADALNAVIAVYHEAVFCSQASLGFLEPGTALRDQMTALLSTFESHRNDLIQLALAQGGTPPTSLGIYDLPPNHDQAGIMTMLAEIQQALAQAVGVWVAAATTPDQAVPELIFAATVGSPFGLGAAVWPGFPDS